MTLVSVVRNVFESNVNNSLVYNGIPINQTLAKAFMLEFEGGIETRCGLEEVCAPGLNVA